LLSKNQFEALKIYPYLQLPHCLELTQRVLWERLRKPQPAVAQFEKATYTPTVDSILAYAQALGIRVNFGIVNS
jgi:hypothetical protein